MDIGLFFNLYAIELFSFIFVNLLVTLFVIRISNALKHPDVAIPMDTPNSKPSDSNLNLSLTVSSTGSMLSESSLSDLDHRSITPDLISSGSTSGSSSNSNTTISSYGSSASGKCFRMSNANFQQGGSRSSESESPYHTTFENSVTQNTPPIVISPPRQEHLIDGSTPSPSPVSERIPQLMRTSLAQRLLSLVDADERPIRHAKRSALKDITNIARTRSSVPGDDECIEDAQFLVYRSAEEFLPTLVSTPPTCNAAYEPESGFFGPSTRFGDMFSPNGPPSTTRTFVLPESFKFSNFAGSVTRISGDIVTSLAKYQNEYPDDYEDDGVVMGEQFEWEDEMRSLELRLGFYGKEI